MRNLNSTIKMAAAFQGLRTPDPVSFEGNVAENWREFERHFTIYRKAALKSVILMKWPTFFSTWQDLRLLKGKELSHTSLK